MFKKFKKHKAFTLAEVLITLAIIGVVAVLTVPTLIANNQEKGWNTASTVFEAKLEQALKVMNTQGTLAGYRTTKDFVDELSNHLKITKVCDSDKLTECFEDKINKDNFIIDVSNPKQNVNSIDVSDLTTAADLGQDDWGTEVLGFQLNNGTSGLIAYNPTSTCHQDQFSNQITETDCVAVVYDTSGFSKPNSYAKDIRTINAKFISGCAFKDGSICYSQPVRPTALSYGTCLAEMSTLGIKECKYSKDYWAGAVNACGSVNKMPTIEQLVTIQKYAATDSSFVKNQLGGSNHLWAGKEFNAIKAYAVRTGGIVEFDEQRSSAAPFVVCAQ